MGTRHTPLGTLRLVGGSQDMGHAVTGAYSAVQGADRQTLRDNLRPDMPLRDAVRQEALRREAMDRHPAGKARKTTQH